MPNDFMGACVAAASRADAQAELVDKLGQQYGVVGTGPSGIFDATPIVQGATDFFIARTQKELLVELATQLSDRMCGSTDSAKPLAEYMPRTCEALRTKDIVAQANATLLLGDSFRDDLDHLAPLAINKLFSRLDTKDPDILAGGCMASLLSAAAEPLLREGLSSALKTMGNVDPFPMLCTRAGLSQKDLSVAMKDADQLIGRAREKIRTTRSVDIGSLVIAMKEEFTASSDVPWLSASRFAIERAALASEKLVAQSSPESVVVQEYLDASFAMMASVANHPSFSGLAGRARVVEGLSESIAAFSEHRYSIALVRFMSSPAVQKAVNSATVDPGTAKALKALEGDVALIASLSDAKTPEAAKDAIDAAAAPLGSWREYRRRTAGFIAGHVGLAVGDEIPLGALATSASVMGPTLPVGLEIAGPTGNDWTFGVLVGVIDLGAIATARLAQSTSAVTGSGGVGTVVPDLTFASIVAPSGALRLGIGDSPFVLSAGAEVLPANRKFFTCSTVCDSPTLVPTLRAQLALTVDVPVVPIF